ncbi:N-acetylmuramoyl-L-alanine amidase family protein [Bacillus paramycoides]|uniref:N-acetylmuramoyl-L-alanine amidase family protein n=1 Tax=Bacillus paramycoides TaxID=2026194 RepID=UPI003D03B85F
MDPGHGGNDPGSIGLNETREKDIALKRAKNTRKHLERKRMTVILTREDNTLYH